MVKIKPMDEIVENYVLSSAEGMWKFRRYLFRRGVKNPTEKAIKYGVKMVLAGTSDLDKAIRMFKDLAEACNTLATALKRVKEEGKK